MDGRSISLSGLRINAAQLAASAQNIANTNTPGYTRTGVAAKTSANGGVTGRAVNLAGGDLSSDLVGQTMALSNYRANIAALKAQDRMDKITLDLIG